MHFNHEMLQVETNTEKSMDLDHLLHTNPGLVVFWAKLVSCVCVCEKGGCMWQWGPADTIYIYMYIYNIGKSRDLCIYIYAHMWTRLRHIWELC